MKAMTRDKQRPRREIRSHLALLGPLALLAATFVLNGCGEAGDTSVEEKQGALSNGVPLGSHGGSGGNLFNIQPLPGERLWIFAMRSGAYVDMLSAQYLNGHTVRGAQVGGNGGTYRDFTLNPSDPSAYFSHAWGRSGAYLDELCMSTAYDGIFCGGGGGGYIWGPDDAGYDSNGQQRQIQGFSGKAGAYIDAITLWAYSP